MEYSLCHSGFYYHKTHHKKVVEMWIKVLAKAKPPHKLTLLYLANDVIQNSRKKSGSQFGDTFGEVLHEASMLLRDEKIRPSVERVFKIWEERNVYDLTFINELYDILENPKISQPVSSKSIADFKPQKVTDQIHLVENLTKETLAKLTILTNSKVDAASTEALCKLKDRKHGQQFSRDFDSSVKCLEDYIRTLEKEVKERTGLITVLEQGGVYYETQRGEARLVASAYRNFGNRVKCLKNKLQEITPTLSSSSPCTDAPSPTNADQGSEIISLLGTLKSESSTSPSPPNLGHSSLESRLSNLSNIIQSTIFGAKHKKGFSTPLLSSSNTNSPHPPGFDLVSGRSLIQETPDTGSGTQLKDEGGGPETPVQDEGESSSSILKEHFENSAQKLFQTLTDPKPVIFDMPGLTTNNTWFIDSSTNTCRDIKSTSSSSIWSLQQKGPEKPDDKKTHVQENKNPSVTDFFQNISSSYLGSTKDTSLQLLNSPATGNSLSFQFKQSARLDGMLKEQHKQGIETEDLEPQDMDLGESDDESVSQEKAPYQVLKSSRLKEITKDSSAIYNRASVDVARGLVQEPYMSAEYGKNHGKPLDHDTSVTGSPNTRQSLKNSFVFKSMSGTQESVDKDSFCPRGGMEHIAPSAKPMDNSVVSSLSENKKFGNFLSDKISAATCVGDILKTLSSAFLESDVKNNESRNNKEEFQKPSTIPIVESSHSTTPVTKEQDFRYVPEELPSVSRLEVVKPLCHIHSEKENNIEREQPPSVSSCDSKNLGPSSQREKFLRDTQYIDRNEDQKLASIIPTCGVSSSTYEPVSRIQTVHTIRQEQNDFSERIRWEEEPVVRSVQQYGYREDYYEHDNRNHVYDNYYSRRYFPQPESYVNRQGWELRTPQNYYGPPPPKRRQPLMKDRRHQFYPY
ncbi:uncharacterized protein LOC106468327 [Limulus polyphemus]|uniref:Uncharacterized protein LOC106468327 n=1 Tax=Limulus polyphemus TaxID=6850 RepID=A0ABM1BL63_LIMPO|nr:uncharacterized protein LOC106468327 [Limulus polyphemus]